MAYPTTWDTFSVKGAGDTIMAAHVNSLQTSLIATQEKLGSGTPLTASTNTALLGTGASSTGYQVISLANTSLMSGILGIANGGTGKATIFSDGGDNAAADYSIAGATLTANGNWQDLDISAIVGAAQKLVLLRLTIQDAASRFVFQVKTKGNSNDINIGHLLAHSVGFNCPADVWVLTNATGVIQYLISAGTDAATMTVGGWF